MKIRKERQVIKTGKTFTVLIVYVFATILSACSENADGISAPVEVMFDSQSEATLGGIRLTPAKSQWDGYGEAVDVHGDLGVSLVSLPERKMVVYWSLAGGGYSPWITASPDGFTLVAAKDFGGLYYIPLPLGK